MKIFSFLIQNVRSTLNENVFHFGLAVCFFYFFVFYASIGFLHTRFWFYVVTSIIFSVIYFLLSIHHPHLRSDRFRSFLPAKDIAFGTLMMICNLIGFRALYPFNNNFIGGYILFCFLMAGGHAFLQTGFQNLFKYQRNMK